MQHTLLGRVIRSTLNRSRGFLRDSFANRRHVAMRRYAYERLSRQNDRILEDIGLTRDMLREWLKTGVLPQDAANDGAFGYHLRQGLIPRSANDDKAPAEVRPVA